MTEPTPTQRDELRKSLDKVLVEATIAMPIESVRRLPSATKAELEVVIREMFINKDILRLAAGWEPLRKLDDDLKETLRVDLIDLIYDRRPQYTGPSLLDLSKAQEQAESYRTYISRTMPTPDAKRLLKTWDKKLKPAPKARGQIIDHLLNLLERTEAHPASRVA